MNGEADIEWSSIRLKYLATINDETLPETTDPNLEINYIDIGNVSATNGVEASTKFLFADAPSRARRIVQDGDVIISTVRTYLQAIAPIENPTENLIVSTGFAVIRPISEKLSPAFCKYSLRESSFLAEVEKRSVGVSYPAVNSSDLGDIFIRVPAASSQREISAFLDQETARLDNLIQAKETMLALLAEKRQALITQTVTRGLDPNVCLKPSGVDWLGDVPAHWEVKRLKLVAEVRGGITVGKNYYSKKVVAFPYLRVANVQDGELSLGEIKTIDVPEDEAASYLLEAGDVLMNEGGDADKLGRGAIWDGSISPCLHQNHVFSVRPFDVTSVWLNMWTGSDVAKAYFESRAKQATNLASLSSSNLKELFILLPDKQEQVMIVNWIEERMKQADISREKIAGSITLLKERRSALITAAVTGQTNISQLYAR